MRNEEPFGSLDGATEHPGSLIEFDDPGLWRDLALSSHDRRARVLVGRRGSGKSRYLREMERSVRNEKLGLYLQKDEKISLDNLRWLHRAHPERSERLETWEALWSCAVYGGICHFLGLLRNGHESRANLSAGEVQFLDKEAARLLPDVPRHMPIVGVLNWILRRYNDRSRLHAFLRDPAWYTLESIVLDTIEHTSPLFAFIDVLDDNYADAPKESTDAQLSLVTWILRKIVDPHVQNRLHVVITVRDTIYAALLETEHGQRYNDRQHIRCLDWNRASSVHYLTSKIRKLRPEFRACSGRANDPIMDWVGFTTLKNNSRGGVEEHVLDFILRHTRFLPREINEVGNAISRDVHSARAQGETLSPSRVMQTTANIAQYTATNILNGITNHMIALNGIVCATPFVEKEYAQLIQEGLKNFLLFLGKERFDWDTAELAAEEFCDRTTWAPTVDGRKLRVYDVLWQHGLIGYRRSDKKSEPMSYFQTSAANDTEIVTRLPGASEYIIHSSVLERFHGISAEGAPAMVYGNDN